MAGFMHVVPIFSGFAVGFDAFGRLWLCYMMLVQAVLGEAVYFLLLIQQFFTFIVLPLHLNRLTKYEETTTVIVIGLLGRSHVRLQT